MEDRKKRECDRGYAAARAFAQTLTTTEIREALERAEDLMADNEAAHKHLSAAYYTGKANAYTDALSKREEGER